MESGSMYESEKVLEDNLIKYPSLHNATYYVGDFDNLPCDAPKRDVLQTYNLVSFAWEI